MKKAQILAGGIRDYFLAQTRIKKISSIFLSLSRLIKSKKSTFWKMGRWRAWHWRIRRTCGNHCYRTSIRRHSATLMLLVMKFWGNQSVVWAPPTCIMVPNTRWWERVLKKIRPYSVVVVAVVIYCIRCRWWRVTVHEFSPLVTIRISVWNM